MTGAYFCIIKLEIKMENEVKDNNKFKGQYEQNRRLGGLVIVLVGLLILLRTIPATSNLFPNWLFTWPMILITVGLFTGIKHRFKHPSWIILIVIGSFFLITDNNILAINLRPYFVPIVIILAGIFVIFKRNRNCNNERHMRRAMHFRHKMERFHQFKQGPFENKFAEAQSMDANEDIINVSSTFGNVERNIFSKNFKGGTISCLFGGTQLNFAQADIQNTAILDISVMFGGGEIIIPSNWNVKNELSVILGGIEDKRKVITNINESGKTLILKGSVMLGGFEIKSY